MKGIGESTDVFDFRIQELMNSGFSRVEALDIMVSEAVEKAERKMNNKKNSRMKAYKIELCPHIDESVLSYFYEQTLQ